MVKVNEIYEIAVYPSYWNTIVTQYNSDKKQGNETLLEREIAGEPVRCMVTGYSWKDRKKPNALLKQKIFVQVTDIMAGNS